MYKLITIVTTCALIACGSDDSNSGDTEASAAEKAERTRTLSLDSKDDLPNCTSDNVDQLVYVTDEEQFYTCKKKKWVEIDIAGEDGADAEQLDDNHFLDKVTGYLWQVGATTSWTTASTGCIGDWSWSDRVEIKAAVTHGLDPDGSGVWSSDIVDANNAYYVTGSATYGTDLKTVLHLAVCVRK